MICVRPFGLLLRIAPVLLSLLGAAGAAAADPPSRVGHLTLIEGSVTFAPAGDSEWIDAQRNRPLTRGDRLWTDRRTRAEMQVGSAAIRLDGQTRLDILALDDQSAQMSVTQGSVFVRVRSLADGENFEIDTPNLAYRAAYPGDYRVDVDPVQGTTRVTIHSGTGAVYGENAQVQTLGGGQQVTFRGRALTQMAAQESPPQDAFDRWSMERDRREDQSIAARYVPREVVGYQLLDPFGQWRRNESYGAVWFPQGMPAKWAPYRQGHWDWIAPWGWTWIDDAAWGFAPFHYGRWVLVDGQWAWAPGRLSVRPVYAPALVAFVGGSSGEAAWFPLAPGEAWQPPYPTSQLYISEVNRNIPVAAPASYAYQRRSEAVTAVAVAEFQRGRPAASGWWRMATNMLSDAPIVPPPAMPVRTAVAHQQPAVRSAPPSSPGVRQVAAQAPPAPTASAVPAPTRQAAVPQRAAPAPAPRQAPMAERPQAASAQSAPPAARAPVATANATATQRPATSRPTASPQLHPARTPAPAAAKAPREPARPTPQTHVAGPAKAPVESAGPRANVAAHAVHAQQASRATARRAQASARTERVRREQVARREEAQKASRQAQARREQQQQRLAAIRREEQSRREARARADEQLRREMHASHVEQARRVADRDARALREQRLQREEQTRRVVQEHDPVPQPRPWERDPQTVNQPAARDRQAWEQRQRQRARPDLRQDMPPRAPEVWQRGIPILNQGPTS